ncbi:hypothetical protein HDU96_005166 [Phlyctochytrium bullatum]|nr:hypothetical protein HDU96_005166 [Phlyctochytrium bullatum]
MPYVEEMVSELENFVELAKKWRQIEVQQFELRFGQSIAYQSSEYEAALAAEKKAIQERKHEVLKEVRQSAAGLARCFEMEMMRTLIKRRDVIAAVLEKSGNNATSLEEELTRLEKEVEGTLLKEKESADTVLAMLRSEVSDLKEMDTSLPTEDELMKQMALLDQLESAHLDRRAVEESISEHFNSWDDGRALAMFFSEQ